MNPRYRTLVFDCDGVVLDSNAVKTAAFHAAALRYGRECADALVDYHQRHGGVSRYRKFEVLLGEIARVPPTQEALDALLADFAAEVKAGLLRCRISPRLETLREATAGTRWMVVSGGDQAELRQVFAERGIDHWFDAGIFGSPDDKATIFTRELARGSIARPALYLGDSRYDHEVAVAHGLDFAFVSAWTEFEGWEEYFGARPPAHLVRTAADLSPELTQHS